MKGKQVTWINCAKSVAILAVMLDHTYGMLYMNLHVRSMTHFAVSLFILLSGITSYMTGEKYKSTGWLKTFWGKIKRILVAYLVASLIYSMVMTRGFHLGELLLSIIHFNASGPLYYVALYIQLMFIYYPLYRLLRWIPKSPRGYCVEILLGVAFLAFGIWSTDFTNILGIAGGGGRLLGGTFLFLFYLGMTAEKHQWFLPDSRGRLWLIFGFSFPTVLIAEALVYSNETQINGLFWQQENTNPPGFLLMGVAICILFLCFSGFSLLECSRLHLIPGVIGRLGRHTLYLFLYHRLFLDTVNHFLRFYLHGWMKWTLYFAVMLVGPMIVEWIFRKCRTGICELRERRSKNT